MFVYFLVVLFLSGNGKKIVAFVHWNSSSFFSLLQQSRIFEELPKAMIVSVSRPDPSDISPMLLFYTIEFKWRLLKKAVQVFYLHFALKKRAFFEEIHEKQEQVKEWLQNLGIGDHTPVVQDEDDVDHEAVPFNRDDGAKNRDVPSIAASPVIHPALGRQHSMSDRAKVAMQEYLNHFFGNMDIVKLLRNATCFLEVDRLLRPGGYLVISGPLVQWVKQEKEWADLQSVARALNYELIAVDRNTVIWKKQAGDTFAPNQNEFGLQLEM